MLANLPIMLFPYAHKFYAFISIHYAHNITGQENNYSNDLTFLYCNIKESSMYSCRVWFWILDSWVGMDSGDDETSE